MGITIVTDDKIKPMSLLATQSFKRLERPRSAPAFRLQERDVAIVRTVAKHRFLTSDQIIRSLTGISAAELATQLAERPWAFQQIGRRLYLLHAHHFLDRPPSQSLQLSAFAHRAYGLGREGARLLESLGDPINAQLDWTLKNTRATSIFLLHTLETADTMLQFEAAARPGGVRLLTQHELLPFFPEATRASHDPFALRVTVQHKGAPLTIAVIPDRLFSIVYPDNTRQTFALEQDRGTMDVTSKRLVGKASFMRKLTGYYASFRQAKHAEVWNVKAFRVLTVTTSDKRIHNLCQAQRTVTHDHANDLFLYTTSARLTEHGPFGSAWLRADGTTTSILRA